MGVGERSSSLRPCCQVPCLLPQLCRYLVVETQEMVVACCKFSISYPECSWLEKGEGRQPLTGRKWAMPRPPVPGLIVQARAWAQAAARDESHSGCPLQLCLPLAYYFLLPRGLAL